MLRSVDYKAGEGLRDKKRTEGGGYSVTSLRGALTTEDLELTPLIRERKKKGECFSGQER